MEDYNSKYSGEEVDGLLDEIGNKVDKVDGKQLSTEDFTTILKQKLDGLSNYDDTVISQAVDKLRTDLDTLVSGDTTTAIKTFNEVIAFLDGIQDSQDLSSIIASIEQQIAGKMDSVTLAKVATSGSYNDLSDKPTIPSAVTENTVSGWGFTKNTGTYSKPSTGIPKTDLASGVQSSLEKADKAQPTLVSGTNIKTINGESILGSGNIAISGDGGKEFVEVEPIFEPGGSTGYFMPENPLQPNKVYVFTETISSLSINSIEASNSIVDEYTVMFTAASTNVVISINYEYQVYWANGVTPSVVEGDMCELSLVRIGNDIKAVLTPFKAVE